MRIALIGKYTVLSDAYLSVTKALQHAAMAAGLKLQLDWVEAQLLEDAAKEGDDAEKHAAAWAQVRARLLLVCCLWFVCLVMMVEGGNVCVCLGLRFLGLRGEGVTAPNDGAQRRLSQPPQKTSTKKRNFDKPPTQQPQHKPQPNQTTNQIKTTNEKIK